MNRAQLVTSPSHYSHYPHLSSVKLSTMATPSVSQQTDTLNTIFLGLRSKSPETRLQSALELRRYVCAFASGTVRA